MAGRSNGVDWVETTEEVVVMEECLPPDDNTHTGISFRIRLCSSLTVKPETWRDSIPTFLTQCLSSSSDTGVRTSRNTNPEVIGHCGEGRKPRGW